MIWSLLLDLQLIVRLLAFPGAQQRGNRSIREYCIVVPRTVSLARGYLCRSNEAAGGVCIML